MPSFLNIKSKPFDSNGKPFTTWQLVQQSERSLLHLSSALTVTLASTFKTSYGLIQGSVLLDVPHDGGSGEIEIVRNTLDFRTAFTLGCGHNY